MTTFDYSPGLTTFGTHDENVLVRFKGYPAHVRRVAGVQPVGREGFVGFKFNGNVLRRASLSVDATNFVGTVKCHS